MSEVKYSVASGNHTFDAQDGLEENFSPVIEQGITRRNRIGNKIQFKFFQWRAHIILNPGTAEPPERVVIRVILFVPKNPYTPTPASSADSVIFDSNGIPAYLSSINSTGARIIMDKTKIMTVNGQLNNEGSMNPYWFIKKKFKIWNKINYTNAASDAILNPTDQIWMLIVTDVSVEDTVSVFLRHVNRMSFLDI